MDNISALPRMPDAFFFYYQIISLHRTFSKKGGMNANTAVLGVTTEEDF